MLTLTHASFRLQDSGLHADLVKRYIDRLGELLADPAVKAHLRDQGAGFPTTHLSHLAHTRYCVQKLRTPSSSRRPPPRRRRSCSSSPRASRAHLRTRPSTESG